MFVQVTTHSKLLTEQERQDLEKRLPVASVTLLSLQAFDTEQQFCQQLRYLSNLNNQVNCKLSYYLKHSGIRIEMISTDFIVSASLFLIYFVRKQFIC